MNLLVHFGIYGHSGCFESSQIALAYGSCNFENFQNITRAHKSQNALAFIRFPIHKLMIYSPEPRSDVYCFGLGLNFN